MDSNSNNKNTSSASTFSTWIRLFYEDPRVLVNMLLVIGIGFIYNDLRFFVSEQTDVLKSVTQEIHNVDMRLYHIEQQIDIEIDTNKKPK